MVSKGQRRRERRGVQDQTNTWPIRPNMAAGRRPSLVVGRSPMVSEFRESPGDFRKAVFSGMRSLTRITTFTHYNLRLFIVRICCRFVKHISVDYLRYPLPLLRPPQSDGSCQRDGSHSDRSSVKNSHVHENNNFCKSSSNFGEGNGV